MKIVFFGTPDFVLPILESIYKTYGLDRENNTLIVVTQPPKPQGREKTKEFSPVDHWAFKKHLTVLTNINETPEADLGVVAAYGAFIPQSVIERFKYGILNIHPSLLPKYRGASPIQAAIALGEREVGVSVIMLDREMDHGPIVSQFRETIQENDTNISLRTKLFERSAEFLIELIPSYLEGKIRLKEQDHAKASFCRIIEKQDGFISFSALKLVREGKASEEKIIVSFCDNCELLLNGKNVHNFIRALTPWPGVWTKIEIKNEEKRLKILEAHLEGEKLVLDMVQLEGKDPVNWKQFEEGYKL
ncbi:hypothetical protein A2382_00005 [Candidatus Woesebacteria bacterium RIFOXYB1_FULL_38_16]|uniref:methionyl-tRNA formyltransferase n=1 Tax=Candidatus Woesebacteria bacterium RIFOXYB1_FULL_38_16 TaxID=1802538 RepID=A0A1F8CUL3_9BACT|nr:MAG: hypothetical protein A2191_01580 [Candidatus Woesebacteria bacterium RIFOXYA1_FULL_38_9]OGM79529.1 MAG: hypothetical protein A2382_00005 [Candidatus Woesebacteria bacterium RIFOXYB1_FULL_38_16]